MRDDCITIELGLPGLRVMGQEETAEVIRVAVQYRTERGRCPRCGRETPTVHRVRVQRKRDRRLGEKAVVLLLHKRRFRCWQCGQVFSEADPVCGARKRTSGRFREALGRGALERPVRHVAAEEGVSDGLVRRSLTAVAEALLAAAPSPQGTRVLGLDEFAVRKGHVYDTALVDLEQKQVLGVVTGRGKQEVERFLTTLAGAEQIERVVMDRHEPFRQAVQLCLPGAAIVADKFHVLAQVHRALDQVRRREQMERGQGDELYRARYLLLRAQERLRPEQAARLFALLERYPTVRDAWLLKEAFRLWYRTETRAEAVQELERLATLIRLEGPTPFRRLLSMLRNWREEILTYFDGRYTNAVVEGKNNRIKVLKRLAYGYRNRGNFRQRIMLTNVKRSRRSRAA